MRSIVLANGDPTGFRQRLKHVIWRLLQVLPDRSFISLKFFTISGRFPNLDVPKTFTDKMQVRKLYDRNPLFPVMVDKHAVKKFVSDRVGEDCAIRTLWLGRDLSEVDWAAIRLPVVVKPTHGSGQGVFLEKPQDIDALLKSDLPEKWLETRHHRHNREWAYGEFEPQLIIEEMLQGATDAPDDYRFFVFSGAVRLIAVRLRRKGVSYEAFFSPDGARLDLQTGYRAPATSHVELPASLPRMISIAEQVASDTDFVRVDLYACDDRVFVGELTLYPGGGFPGCVPEAWDRKLGDMWDLRAKPPG
ncbi:ATP-grasp fold amidoligase family protein [Roseibium sp. MMSF_3412]|uniref:ATP-grasp fold amidoligase family protein n=1 Tax=Roseibium sp. MMSF_3412 TaxID=3046712 RepID=UPI00273DE626|nr:ATP-grasp fold amidoligase family protein [Roseibium sp. MMSF_3412]